MMKKNYFILIGLVLFATIMFSSCEKEDNETQIAVFELIYPMSDDILKTTADARFGIMTVTHDAENVYFNYGIYPWHVELGWTFNTTYLYLGDYSNLEYNSSGNIDWYSDIMSVVTHEENPTHLEITVPIESLPSFDFGITAKVKLNNPHDKMNPNPRVYVYNMEDEDDRQTPWATGFIYSVGR